MDFSNREPRPQQAPAAAPQPVATRSSRRSDKGKWGRVGLVAALLAVVAIIVGCILLIASSNTKPESSYIKKDKLQAVFLNTGQVYFGNIKNLNTQFLTLTNIYYLQTAASGTSQSSASNVTLVKLGCELHEPYDQMVINRGQVTFWENLQDNGQVATAVKNFENKNPGGQKCADQSSSASTNSVNNTQNAGNSATPTTNATSNTTNSSTNSSTSTTPAKP